MLEIFPTCLAFNNNHTSHYSFIVYLWQFSADYSQASCNTIHNDMLIKYINKIQIYLICSSTKLNESCQHGNRKYRLLKANWLL